MFVYVMRYLYCQLHIVTLMIVFIQEECHVFHDDMCSSIIFGFSHILCFATIKLVEEAQRKNPMSLTLCLIASYNVLDHAYVDTRKTYDIHDEQPTYMLEYAMGRVAFLVACC